MRAAVFDVVGGSNYTLPDSYNPSPSTPNINPGTVVTLNGTLTIDRPGYVTFTYIGKEASWNNLFKVNGETIFDTHQPLTLNTPITLRFGSAGTLPFSFSTVGRPGEAVNGLASPGMNPAMALFLIGPRTAYALFNDAFNDRDFDDVVIRMDVAPIPLPAAAWLLLAGLGGLTLVRRRAMSAA